MTDPETVARGLTPEMLISVSAKLRDELTADNRWPNIYPMALDVIASTPPLADRLVRALLEKERVG